MRTARSSSRRWGGLVLIPLNFPLGCGPEPDPPQFPPWVLVWRGVGVCSGRVCSWGCLLRGVSALGGCLLQGGVCSLGVCLFLGGVSAPGGCLLLGGVCSWGCLLRGCLLWGAAGSTTALNIVLNVARCFTSKTRFASVQPLWNTRILSYREVTLNYGAFDPWQSK